MNRPISRVLVSALTGLKPMIAEAADEFRMLPYSVAESLNSLREQIIAQLDQSEQELAERTIAPLQVRIPISRSDSRGELTLHSREALTLYNQLEGLTLSTSTQAPLPDIAPIAESGTVFVVHGRDTAGRETVARFLERLGLRPIILHEQASVGRTIIEKLEAHSHVSFAVVLLSGDDEGRLFGAPALSLRARQNVILELGFFIGKLGRRNVCALYTAGVEIPSDYLGVLFVPFDVGDGWKLQLAKEMKAAGLSVDMNRVF